MVDLVNNLVVFLGTLLALALAIRSFQKRSVQLGDEPTLPRYFTRTGLYWLGLSVYALIIGSFFYVLVTEWLPIEPFITIIFENRRSGTAAQLFQALNGRNVAPLIVAIAFLVLIGWENRFNPLLILRDTVFDVFAIPRKVLEVYNVLRGSRLSEIPDEQRENIVERMLVQSVDLGDFDMASNTVEHRWARACVFFDEIQSFSNRSSFQRFFSEPSLKWGDICVLFNKTSERVAVWRSGPQHYTKTMNLLEELDRLDSLLCRFLACVILVGSGNEAEIWESARRVGGTAPRMKLKHTYKYVWTFTAAIVLAVLLGREFAVFVMNAFFYPDDQTAHFGVDTVRWIIYAIPMYIVPILVVFATRIYGYRTGTVDESRHYGFYLLMMLVGFIVATSVSALILGVWTSDTESFDFFDSFGESTRWGILPALMAGFVAYQMDTQPDDDETKPQMFAAAFLRFIVAGLLALIIMLYATDDLLLIDPKLRITVVITSIVIGGSMAAVARFKLVLANGA